MRILAQVILFSLASATPATATNANAQSAPLWTAWYTYSRNNQPAGYYKETLSMRENGGEYELEQEIWERQGSGLVNTYVNSRSKKNASFSPSAFYVKKRTLGSIDIIEGIANGTELGVRFHRGDTNEVPGVKLLKLDEQTILGAFAPIFMATTRKLKGAGNELRASTVLEEGDAGKHQAKPFRAQASGKSAMIEREKCDEYLVNFDGLAASWWITEQGKLCRIHVPSVGTRLELSNERSAKQYL